MCVNFTIMVKTNRLLVVLWMFFSGTVSLTWSSSINSIFNTRSIMPSSSGLSANLVESIANGAQMAMNHCQGAFKWNRWNCPETTFSRRIKHSATKELAYARAIVSAGVVHTITRNCSRGEIAGCGCNPKFGGQAPLSVPGRDVDPFKQNETNIRNEHVDWSWGGCSDHVEYGIQIAKHFLDDLERDSDVQTLINLHNNVAGRTIVKQSMVKRCRCHGVSGSCTVQTCWMQVAPFASIAAELKARYEKAIRLDVETNMGNSAVRSTPEKLPPTPNEALVYLDQSPDYCRNINEISWSGTRGRSCSRSKLETAPHSEKKSCRNICRTCGHRVRKQKRTISTRCNCTFKWCCEVICSTCVETVEEYYCD